MEQDAEHLKASLRAYRGQLTMKVKRATRAINTAELSPTKQAFSDLKARKADLEDAITKLEEATKKAMEVDPDETILQKSMNEIDVAGDLEQKMVALIGDEPEQRPSPENQETPPKPNGSLKPPQLQVDHTPEELRLWKDGLEAYFESGKLHNYSTKCQRQFLTNLLDHKMAKRLRSITGPDTPVLGPGGCVEIIEQEFTQIYPVLSRRVDYLQCFQRKGQDSFDLVTDLNTLFNNADLENLTVRELHPYKIIASITEPELAKKLTAIASPTEEKVMRKIDAHRRAKKNLKTMGSPKRDWRSRKRYKR